MQEALAEILKEQPGATIMLLVMTAMTVVFALSVTLLMYRGNFRRYLALRGINPWHLLTVFLLVPPGYVIVIAVYYLAAEFLPNFGFMEELEETVKGTYWPLLLLAGAVFPGFGEEVLCRGFLGRGLVAKRGVIFGIFFASLFFGALHVEPAQVAYTFVMGLTLHFVYLTTKTLLAPILLHGVHNAMAFILPQLAMTYPDSAIGMMETPGQLSPLLLGAAIAAEITLLLFLFRTRIQWWLPSGEAWSPGYVTAEMPHAGLQAVPRRGAGPWWIWLLAIVGYGSFVAVVAYQLTRA
jgi:membrane protease YdiL (CAAX protease family)